MRNSIGVRDRLQVTLVRLRRKLLVVDPFVRLHRTDENAAAEVDPSSVSCRRTFHDPATSWGDLRPNRDQIA